MRTRDYLVGIVGIIGSLNVFGFLGKYFFILLPFFWFFSIYVVLFSLVAVLYKWFAKILTPLELRRYVFFLCTNALPTLAIWIAHDFDLKPMWLW